MIAFQLVQGKCLNVGNFILKRLPRTLLLHGDQIQQVPAVAGLVCGAGIVQPGRQGVFGVGEAAGKV